MGSTEGPTHRVYPRNTDSLTTHSRWPHPQGALTALLWEQPMAQAMHKQAKLANTHELLPPSTHTAWLQVQARLHPYPTPSQLGATHTSARRLPYPGS